MSTWVRTVQSDLTWISGSVLLATVPPGKTLIRTHFGWGFHAHSRSSSAMSDVADNLMVMGVCTTDGTAPGSAPNARTAPGDQAPPAQRWVWWESRAPTVAALDAGGDLVVWRDSGPQSTIDSKGMVSTAGLPAGHSLGVWASWAAARAWEANAYTDLWLWASILYQ